MSKATLELGGGNWAAKYSKLLGYAVGDTSGKYIPRELTFSRAADIAATRVNKDGLIEKFRENQFTYSNDFRISSGWGHAGLSAYYGPENNPQYVPDGEQGYDGSGGASFIVSTTNTQPSTSVHRISASIPSITAVQTFSIYAKALGYKWLAITTNSGAMEAYFDLENGELGTVESNVIEAKMVDAGNGWYRCSMTVSNAIVVTSVGFGISDGDENHVFAGSRDEGGTNRGGIYVMHAQWDRGFVATEYLDSGSTTAKAGVLDNLPRIDYTSGSAQLLLEPSKTNICLNSEGVGSIQGSGATATLDQDVVSPTGYKGGVVELTNLLGAVNDRKQFVADIASDDRGEPFSASVYVKGTPGETMSYQFKRITGNYVGAPKVRHTFSGEWERLDQTFTTLADTEKVGFHFTNDSDTADSICIWGMQIEQSDFATSYIPTYGTQDTRGYDNANFDYDAATDAWTIYMDVSNMNVNGASSNQGHMKFKGQDNNTVDALFFFGTCFGYKTTDTSAPAYPNKYICSGLGVSGSVFNGKWAVTYDGATTMKVYVDGSLYSTKTDVDPTPTRGIQSFQLQYNSNDSNTRRSIREFKIYNEELSQTEAEALTA